MYVAAVLESLAAELLHLSGNVADDLGASVLVPRHVVLAVRSDDEELNAMVGTVMQQGMLELDICQGPPPAAGLVWASVPVCLALVPVESDD